MAQLLGRYHGCCVDNAAYNTPEYRERFSNEEHVAFFKSNFVQPVRACGRARVRRGRGWLLFRLADSSVDAGARFCSTPCHPQQQLTNTLNDPAAFITKPYLAETLQRLLWGHDSRTGQPNPVGRLGEETEEGKAIRWAVRRLQRSYEFKKQSLVHAGAFGWGRCIGLDWIGLDWIGLAGPEWMNGWMDGWMDGWKPLSPHHTHDLHTRQTRTRSTLCSRARRAAGSR